MAMALIALIIGACVVAAYYRGLFGAFLFDDFHNIVENPAIQAIDGSSDSWLAASFSSNAGKLRRPVSMASFGANHLLFGMHPFAFKAVNLALHLLCGLLIYRISLYLVPRLLASGSPRPAPDIEVRRISLVIAAIWLLHPLSVSSVLYVVQRMNQLSTLFILLGVLIYIAGRVRSLNGQSGLLLALTLTTLCAGLASFSKENGALIFAYLLIVEWICFRFAGLGKSDKRLLSLYFGVFLIVPIVLVALYLGLNPDWLSVRYQRQDFTLEERLLTQPRIISHYLLWIFVPLPQLMGIYHDDIPDSTGLLSPWTTFPTILVLFGALMTAVALRRRHPPFAFAVLWFAVGHSMESTFIPLEQVFEHRNYAPMIGLIIGTAILAWKALGNCHNLTKLGIGAATIVILAAATTHRAALWSDPLQMSLAAASRHPASARSQYDAGRLIYIDALANNELQSGRQISKPYFEKAMTLAPDYVNPVASLMLTQYPGQAIPQDLFSELTSRVRRSRELQPNAILLIQNAVTDGQIDMSPEQVNTLFAAAMDNASLLVGARAQLLSNHGRYHFVRLNNTQAAVSLTLAAAETDPKNPAFQINLAKLALALDQPDIATLHLEHAKRLDIGGVYREQISLIATQVSDPRGTQ